MRGDGHHLTCLLIHVQMGAKVQCATCYSAFHPLCGRIAVGSWGRVIALVYSQGVHACWWHRYIAYQAKPAPMSPSQLCVAVPWHCYTGVEDAVC
jgi:hypothetical protein